MSRKFQPERLNVQALAEDSQTLSAATSLQHFQRIAQEAQGLAPDQVVQWEASAELRPQGGAGDQIWLHLHAASEIPLTCQRCLSPVAIPVEVDQWYRFVDNEDTAMAEDDKSEEDLLVLEPQFDLFNLIEDELLMALPLVPMHENCPVSPPMSAGESEIGTQAARPNPFAVLGKLKKSE
ncbi:MAG: YceD family protein [Pseudomonadota bacterium]